MTEVQLTFDSLPSTMIGYRMPDPTVPYVPAGGGSPGGYVPGGGGSPAPLPILKAQLTNAIQTALGISLKAAEDLALPIATDLANAIASGNSALTAELQWQLRATVEVTAKRLSAAKRAALMGIIQSVASVASYALGAWGPVLQAAIGKLGGV